MDAVLPLIAIAVLLAGGCGAALLLFGRRHRFDLLEFVSISIFLGLASVAAPMFLLGFFLRHPWLTALVTLLQCALLGAGLVAWRRRGLAFRRWNLAETAIVLALIGTATGFMTWTTLHAPHGWDGMIIWELKARFITLHGGHLPTEFLNDPLLRWTHAGYPQLFPMSKSWLYFWLGGTHQQLGKLIDILFFLAAACQLYSGARQLAATSAAGLAALFLLLTLPFTWIADGSVASGLADFPLAALYVGMARYAASYAAGGRRDDLMLAGSLAAISCWTKQEGMILWLVMGLLLLVATAERRERWSALATAMVPGAVVLAAWKGFHTAIAYEPAMVYRPFSFALVVDNYGRMLAALDEVWLQTRTFMTWNLIWFAIPVAALAMLLRAPRRARLVLLGAVVLPIIIYSSVYIFSYWDPTLHLQSSMFRLLISPALVGILFVAVSFGEAVNAVKNPLILHERRIVIVNDFGEPARFVSFKAAIASRTGAPIVDLGRGSAAGDLEAAARLILDIEPSWEAGTIFVAALGGESGTGEAVALAYHEKIFVAPAEMARFLPGRAVRLPDTQAGDSSADLAEVTAAIANGEHLAYSHRPVSGTPAAAGIS